MKTLDAAWLLVESQQTPMHVGCLQIFKLPGNAGRPYIRRLVAAARASDSLAPPFSLQLDHSTLASVLPSWEDARHPDMMQHVQHHALPAPGDTQELAELVGRLQGDELDMSRPLWECHVIEGLTHRRFAMFTKIHHSLLDGVSGMRMLEETLSTSRASDTAKPLWAPQTDAEHTSTATESAHAPMTEVAHLLQFAAQQWHALPGLYRVANALGKAALRPTTSPISAPYTAPRSVLNQAVSTERRVAMVDLPLTRVRRLAQRAGVTINDVFLALCSGALRRYLQELDALPQAPMVAGLPVSVRPAGDRSVGMMVTFILSSLATDLADPLARLEAIHRSTQAAKAQLQQLDQAALTEYTLLLMTPFIVKLMTGLGAAGHPVFNVTVSNVPGPRRNLYYNGARLEAMYPTSIVTHGQALNITVLSYAGRLNVGFTACGHAVPHPERLAGFTEQALEELSARLATRR